MSDHNTFHKQQSQNPEGYGYRGWEFDNLLEMFSDNPEELKEHLHRLLQSKIGPLNAFELGCGDGTLIREMQSMWGTVKGTEISLDDMREEFQKELDEKLGIHYEIGAIEDYIDSIPKNSLDFIASRKTLEHLENPLFILKKLYDKLALNGEMYIHWGKIEESWNTLGSEIDGLDNFKLFVENLRNSGIDIQLIESNYNKDPKLLNGRIIIKAGNPKKEMNIDNVKYRTVNRILTVDNDSFEVIKPRYSIN